MGRKKGGFKFPGLSYSPKRALGITKAKRRIAKSTGIPTTRSGRRNKAGRLLSGGCCLIPTLSSLVLFLLIYILLFL